MKESFDSSHMLSAYVYSLFHFFNTAELAKIAACDDESLVKRVIKDIEIDCAFHTRVSMSHKMAIVTPTYKHPDLLSSVCVILADTCSLRARLLFQRLDELINFFGITQHRYSRCFVTPDTHEKNTSTLRPGYFGNEFLCTYVIFNNRQNRHLGDRT